MSRISVIRLTPAANRADSRAPARPPSASAIVCNAPVRLALRRPYRTVRPGTCSAKVVFLQAASGQKNRRTVRQIVTS